MQVIIPLVETQRGWSGAREGRARSMTSSSSSSVGAVAAMFPRRAARMREARRENDSAAKDPDGTTTSHLRQLFSGLAQNEVRMTNKFKKNDVSCLMAACHCCRFF